MTTRSKLRGEEGAAAVEFALVVSLLFVLLFGIMEFGLAFFELQNLRSATREGARAAASAALPTRSCTRSSRAPPARCRDGFSGYTLAPTARAVPRDEGRRGRGDAPVRLLPANVASTFEINIPFIPAFTLSPDIRGSFRCE